MISAPVSRDNNFDFLRQFAAFLVIVGHSQSLIAQPVTGLWGASISTLGVQIFFAISGYLISDSWLRAPELGAFLKKRSFRIFPALIVCTVLCAFLLGPLMTRLTLSEYFQHDGTWNYLRNALLYPTYFLPAVFETNTYPNAINGSLWSLPIEFFCYIGVVLAGLMLGRPRPLVALAFGLVIVAVGHIGLVGADPIVIYGSPLREALTIIPFFIGGAVFRLILRPGLFRADLAVLGIGTLSAVGLIRPDLYWAITWLVVPYLVLCFGLSSLPVLSRFGRFGDPSYGMYLYSFPVQQTLQHLSGNSMSLVGMISWTLVLSVLLGFTSWYLVERPVLNLTKRGMAMPKKSDIGA